MSLTGSTRAGVGAWHGAGGVVHALSMVPVPFDTGGAVGKGWATPRRPRPVDWRIGDWCPGRGCGDLATGHLAHEEIHRLELLGVLAESRIGHDDFVDADLLELGDGVSQLGRRADDDPAR